MALAIRRWRVSIAATNSLFGAAIFVSAPEREQMYYSPQIQKAIDFAIKVHETDSKKKRKGKDIPYIVHSLTVGLILSRVIDDEEIVIAGILHDTIEDCEPYGSVTVKSITQMFSERVADLVNSVTEQDKNLPWKERKQNALDHIKEMNHDQLLVKSADVLNNLTELLEDIHGEGLKVFDNFNASQEMVINRYKNIELNLQDAWSDNPLLPELKTSVNQLIQLVEAKSEHSTKKQRADSIAEGLVNNIFEVYTEDHWDFYKEPRIRPTIGKFRTYEEAVLCAQNWVTENMDTLITDPACCGIVPEPEGRHFDSHEYEEKLRKKDNVNK